MISHYSPSWDALMFSITPKRLSIEAQTQPCLKYLQVTIREHTTGNKVIIPEYPCKKDHSPSIEEMLLFLLDKSQLYLDARNSHLPPQRYVSDHFKLNDCQKGYKVFISASDCFNALNDLLNNTGVSYQDLYAILK